MADISKLTLNGTSYDIKDTTARSWASSALSLISTIQNVGVRYSVAESLPAAGVSYEGWIYLIPNPTAPTGNIKNEYICIQKGTGYAWELIGSTETDLSGYISGIKMAITVPSASHSHTFELPNLVGASYTPAGTIDLGATTNSNSGTASVTQSAVNISLSGSYTPAGSITTNASSGDVQIVVGATGLFGKVTYGNPTISSSTKASALTSATLQYTYDSTNENLTFGSGTSVVALSITSANCFTGFTLSQGTSTEGAVPILTKSYIAFSGTSDTVTTSGSYSKVSNVKYDTLSFSPTFTGTAATITPTYSSVVTLKHTGYATTGASGAISGVSGVSPDGTA